MTEDSTLFIYSDAHGNITGREVSDISENEFYIQAICHKAQELRTFRKDRILEYVSNEAELVNRLDYFIKNSPPPQNPAKRNPDNLPEVCFTGFKKNDKQELVKLAEDKGLCVRPSVTKKLEFLCCGYNAGPSKIKKARNLGVMILNESQFKSLLETGEVPEDI